jgi:DNA-binding GntR family transcriptional regulator
VVLTTEDAMPKLKRVPPKYVQIADHLRDRIARGELRPGDEVPSEHQVAAEWGVSRPTATKALDILRREGHVIGRQGAGTFVTEPLSLRRPSSDRYLRSVETGRIYLPNERARILSAELVEAPADIADALGLAKGSQVVRRRRLTMRDDEPVELSTSWLDGQVAKVAPRLLETGRILDGTVAYAEEMTGRRATVARDRVSARLATAEERELLALPDPSAAIISRHSVLDADGLVIEFAESVGPPDAWSVEQVYQIGR